MERNRAGYVFPLGPQARRRLQPGARLPGGEKIAGGVPMDRGRFAPGRTPNALCLIPAAACFDPPRTRPANSPTAITNRKVYPKTKAKEDWS